jgi:hypothetical protein
MEYNFVRDQVNTVCKTLNLSPDMDVLMQEFKRVVEYPGAHKAPTSFKDISGVALDGLMESGKERMCITIELSDGSAICLDSVTGEYVASLVDKRQYI